MEPVKIVSKKPIWSTWVWSLDGTGVVIHNYADGTNSGPLKIFNIPYVPLSRLKK